MSAKLLAAIRAATGPSRALDAQISVALRLGIPKHTQWALRFPVWRAEPSGRVSIIDDQGGVSGHFSPPQFTRDTDVISATIPPDAEWVAGHRRNSVPWACIIPAGGAADGFGYPGEGLPSVALCLCAARIELHNATPVIEQAPAWTFPVGARVLLRESASWRNPLRKWADDRRGATVVGSFHQMQLATGAKKEMVRVRFDRQRKASADHIFNPDDLKAEGE